MIMENLVGLPKRFTYSTFFVLLLQEGRFGHNTHTQLHTRTYSYVCHINPKWHAVSFHTKPFSSLPLTFPGRPYIVPRGSHLSCRRGHLEASLTNSLPLLHQRSKMWPPHHIPQGTLLNMMFPTPPIGKNTLPLSGIRGWRLMITWNHPPRIFLQLTLLILTHCLRDRLGGGMALIAVLW